MTIQVHVGVPATSANLGPGFESSCTGAGSRSNARRTFERQNAPKFGEMRVSVKHLEAAWRSRSEVYAPAEGLRRWRASLMGEEVVKLLRSA